MEIYLPLAGVLGALLLGAISPGPSFILVARTSLAVSRRDALYMAVGMGVGGVLFTLLVLAGLQAVLDSAPWLYLFLKITGGLYLVYLGVSIWQSTRRGLPTTAVVVGNSRSAWRSFLLALLTQISNPKAVVIYGSIFAALLPPDLPPGTMIALPFLVFVVETGWYTVVALSLSAQRPANAYLRARGIIDRLVSTVMAGLGLKLLFDVRELVSDPAAL